jgi:hypothetical protein
MIESTTLLIDLVSRKCDCLEQLLALSRQQLELIETDRMAGLIEVLTGKHRLIGLLQGIDQQLTPYRGQRPEERTWRSEEDRALCGARIAHCEAMLADILRLERLAEERLTAQRDATAARIDSAWQATTARGAYDVTRRSGARLDLVSEG